MSLIISPGSGLWTFLGEGTASAAVRTGLVTWSDQVSELYIIAMVTGYSNTTVSRLLLGPLAGASETTANVNGRIIENTTATALTSISGWPMSGSITNLSRYWVWHATNPQTAVKRIVGQGYADAVAPAVGTAPTASFTLTGTLIDTTNLIQSAKLVNYDAITGNTVSTRTMNAGSYIRVWGRNDATP